MTLSSPTQIRTIWDEDVWVRSFETDLQERWKPACFFQNIQETATHHATHLGYPYAEMMAQDMIWILSRVKIRIHRFPRLGEQVHIQTWPKGIGQKLFFLRDFLFTHADGSIYAEATTAWILIRPSARRMVPPTGLYGVAIPDNDGRNALNEPLERIGLPDEPPQECQVITAGYSAIDLMGHVNNARYVEWICDCFSQQEYRSKTIDWLQINYSSEVKPDERVSITKSPLSGIPEGWVLQGTNLESGAKSFEAVLHFIQD